MYNRGNGLISTMETNEKETSKMETEPCENMSQNKEVGLQELAFCLGTEDLRHGWNY